MQLDPNIILGAKPAQIESPVNALAKVLQVQESQQMNQQRGMQMQDAAKQRETQNRLQALLSQYGNAPDLPDQLAKSGFLEQATAVQKSRGDAVKQTAEAGKITAETEKTQIANTLAKIELVGQIMAGVNDQATYDQAREVARANGIDVSQMAPEYNPQQIEINKQRAMSVAQRLEQVWKQKGYDLDVQKFGETKRSNKADEAIKIQGQNITVRGQNLTDARGREGNALKFQELQMMGSPSSGPVLGVPAPAVAPWANQSNPKDANKVKANEQTRGAKEIEKDIDAARKSKDAAAAAKRFLELNKQTNTGGMLDRFSPTRALQGLGSNYSEMESITAKLAPAMRVEGSGSTSDFDGRQFERATVGVDKPGSANRNIAQGVIARAQQDEEYADFRQTYLEQNGTLQGADRYWKDYANKNPIFDPNKEGTFELNKSRKPWKDHFKASHPAQQKPASGGVVDFGSLK